MNHTKSEYCAVKGMCLSKSFTTPKTAKMNNLFVLKHKQAVLSSIGANNVKQISLDAILAVNLLTPI